MTRNQKQDLHSLGQRLCSLSVGEINLIDDPVFSSLSEADCRYIHLFDKPDIVIEILRRMNIIDRRSLNIVYRQNLREV